MNEGQHCYIGLDENGNLALFLSPEDLRPFGTRLLKGRPFPAPVTEFYHQEHAEYLKQALRSGSAFLRGEEAGVESLQFGQSTKKRK